MRFSCWPKPKASSPSRPAARRSPATIELIRRGVIGRDESMVVCITGNGYKTAEVVKERLAAPVRLSRAFKEFEAWWEARQALATGERARLTPSFETTGSLKSSARPFRSTRTVAVDPTFASATSRKNCDGSSTFWLLKPTMTSPGRRPAS